MNWLFKFFRKKSAVMPTAGGYFNPPVNSFWLQVPEHQIAAYQYFLDKTLDACDLELNTNWARGKKVDGLELDRDSEVQAAVCEEAQRAGLMARALQIMVWQYFFASEMFRSADRFHWAQHVRYREDVDYYPSAEEMFDKIERMSSNVQS